MMSKQEIAAVVEKEILSIDDCVNRLVNLVNGPSRPGRMMQIKETVRELATRWYGEKPNAKVADEEES